jgi:hypothetical protein
VTAEYSNLPLPTPLNPVSAILHPVICFYPITQVLLVNAFPDDESKSKPRLQPSCHYAISPRLELHSIAQKRVFSLNHSLPSPFPFSAAIPLPHSRITKVKEIRIRTPKRRLCTRRTRTTTGNHTRHPIRRRPSTSTSTPTARTIPLRRRHTLRLLVIAIADRQRLITARVSGRRARVVLVVAGAVERALEVGEGAAVYFEGVFGVAG